MVLLLSSIYSLLCVPQQRVALSLSVIVSVFISDLLIAPPFEVDTVPACKNGKLPLRAQSELLVLRSVCSGLGKGVPCDR